MAKNLAYYITKQGIKASTFDLWKTGKKYIGPQKIFVILNMHACSPLKNYIMTTIEISLSADSKPISRMLSDSISVI
jgi:hypothetical protein